MNVATVKKPTTTSKTVNNKVTTTKPSTTVTKPATAPSTTNKSTSTIVNNKTTATTPKVSNDTYVPMMGSVLNDYYSGQKTNGTVNNNGVTSPDKVSTNTGSSSSSGSGKSGVTENLSDGGTRVYNDAGTWFTTYDANGKTTGGGQTGTENWSAQTSGMGSGNVGQTSTQNPEYSKLLQQLTDLQSSFDTRYSTLEDSWTSKYSDLEALLKTQQEEAQSKYQALLDKYNYSNSLYKQQMGSSVPTASAGGTQASTAIPIDGVTTQNSYNDTLYKYLQNIWSGGF